MTYLQKYLENFETLTEAVDFEHEVLNSGEQFLPACAKKVKSGENPTNDYWRWLCGQLSGE